MAFCLEDFVDCLNKTQSPLELLKLLLAKVGVVPNEKPAIRVCVSNADELGGLISDEFIASAAQTDFPLSEPLRIDYAAFKNGAIKPKTSGHSYIAVGNLVRFAVGQPLGTEIIINH